MSKGITSVTVNNGGSGYVYDRRGIDTTNVALKSGGTQLSGGDWTVTSVNRYAEIWCRVYDEAGTGAGAVVTPVVKQTKVGIASRSETATAKSMTYARLRLQVST